MYNIYFKLSIKGILLQVYKESACLNDTAVFTCTNEVGSYIVWDISSGFRGIYSKSFTHGNPTGRKFNRNLGSSTIVAELEFANSTFITSTLMIIGVTYFKGNTVSCNLEETVLDSTVTDPTNISKFFPHLLNSKNRKATSFMFSACL